MPKLGQRGAIQFIILFLLLAGIIGGVYLVTSGNPLKLFSKASNQEQSIPELTNQLTSLNEQVSTGRGAQSTDSQNQKITQMIQVSLNRQARLIDKLSSNPGDFFKYAVLTDQKDKFPEQIKSFIEEEKSLAGELDVIHGDDMRGRKAQNDLVLKSDEGNKYQLYFAQGQPKALSGSKVSLHGIKLAGRVALESSNKTDKYNLQVTQYSHPNSQGPQKVVVVPVNIDSTTITSKPEGVLNNIRGALGGGSSSGSGYVLVNYPNGGERFNPGQEIDITWSTNLSEFEIYAVGSSGDSMLIGTWSGINVSDHQYRWTIPDTLANSSIKIKIHAYRYATMTRDGAVADDTSDNDIYIGNPPAPVPSVTVTPTPVPTPAPTPTPIPVEHLVLPVSSDQLNKLIFDRSSKESLVSYYEENALGQLSISGEVLDPVTITGATAGCDYWIWSNQADKYLKDKRGIDVNTYQKIIYVFPDMMDICKPYGARGSLGGNPGRSWIWSDQTESKIYLHEFGHTLGVDHANLSQCGSKAIDDYSRCKDSNPYPDQTQPLGRGIEYGEKYDVMGSYYNGDGTIIKDNFLLNAPHKAQLGWIPQGSVTQIGSDRVVTLKPPVELEGNSRDFQVLKVRKEDTQEVYFISYRRPLGSDNNLPAELTEGAVIHIGKDENIQSEYYPTILVDTTPNTPGKRDEALSDGSFFYDQINKLLIRQISHDESSVTVEVKFNQNEAPPSPTPAPPPPQPPVRGKTPPPPPVSKDSPTVSLDIPSIVKVNQQVIPLGSISSTRGVNQVWSYVTKDGGTKPVRVTADDVTNFNPSNFKCADATLDDCNWYLISITYGTPFSTVLTPKQKGTYKIMIEVEPNTIDAKAHYCSSNPYVSYPFTRGGITYYRCGEAGTVVVN